MARTIVFLVSHSVAGGAQEIWANLADGFRERGYKVLLAALYPSHVSRRETPDGIEWMHIVEQRPLWPHDQIAMVLALAKFFKTHKPVAVFTALPAANVLAPIAARIARTGVKVVTSHHSPSDTYHPVLDRVDALTGSMREVSTIISVSRTVQDTHDRKPRAYRDKLLTVKNALPVAIESHIAALSAQRPRDRARGRLVVATGRLAYQKNYPVLIRAAAHMPDVTIDIIGAGSDEADLRALAEQLGVSERVRFLGFRPRPEALTLLAEGDVFVQPSLFEGHSLALIEAAKLGLPLVVSDAPVQIEGVSDITGEHCGVIVGVHDDVSLAREITRLLDDAAHYRLYAEKSARLAASVTYEAMILAYEGLLAPAGGEPQAQARLESC